MKIKTDSEYKSFVEDIKKRVRASQYEALKAVNKELLHIPFTLAVDVAILEA